MSKYRKPMSNGSSQKMFTNGAMNINRKNIAPRMDRGGIRL